MRKQTVKTSRVAAQLEKMFRLLNEHFYNGQLPEVVISLKKTLEPTDISPAGKFGKREMSAATKSILAVQH